MRAARTLMIFLAGVVLSACGNRTESFRETEVSSGTNPDKPTLRALLPPPGPRVVKPRDVAIREDADAIRAECQRAAGGDWDAWQLQTAPYRAALRARLDALKTYPAGRSHHLESQYEALEGSNQFPLFEVAARTHLNYLYDERALDGFRRERAVLAAHRWLRRRGIDLIFVPVPKMTEVYVEHFLDPCPADGVIAPHVRHTLLELLEADIEVVDGLRLFRQVRQPDPEYLYNTADTHWAPRGMRVMAREVADRIARYDFGAKARAAPAVVIPSVERYNLDGVHGGVGSEGGWTALNERQQQVAKKAQTMYQVSIYAKDNGPAYDVPRSPVFLLGHSYATDFREQLIRELNLLLRTRGSPTTEGFADFLRDPELLDGCRVVVWVSTEQHLTHLRPMPAPIRSTLNETK